MANKVKLYNGNWVFHFSFIVNIVVFIWGAVMLLGSAYLPIYFGLAEKTIFEQDQGSIVSQWIILKRSIAWSIVHSIAPEQ